MEGKSLAQQVKGGARLRLLHAWLLVLLIVPCQFQREVVGKAPTFE